MSVARAKLMGLGVAALFAALWVAPLTRAVAFARWAGDEVAETHSLNADNDLQFGREALVAHVVALAASLALAWLVGRRPRAAFSFPLALLVVVAVEAIIAGPSPIVLFPTFIPRLQAIVSLVALSFGASLYLSPSLVGAGERPGAI